MFSTTMYLNPTMRLKRHLVIRNPLTPSDMHTGILLNPKQLSLCGDVENPLNDTMLGGEVSAVYLCLHKQGLYVHTQVAYEYSKCNVSKALGVSENEFMKKSSFGL